MTALDIKIPGIQPLRPKGFQMRPPSSCTMKRPTRVPASSTVRIKSASNMIAKWYQMLDRKSTRLNSSHSQISYAVFCLKKKKQIRYGDETAIFIITAVKQHNTLGSHGDIRAYH